jgi:ABC-type transport system substrate-binding protein
MKRLLLLLAILPFFISGCQQGPSEGEKKPQPKVKSGGAYRVAFPWSPRDLDPPFSTDIYSITLIQQIFDGLVQFDRNLNTIPALATSWKVSRDGLTYTFSLRQDASFHNGRRVTADDFVYSFSRILSPDKQAGALNFFEKIEGAIAYKNRTAKKVEGLKAVNPHTLEITLREPFAPFLSVLAMKDSKVVPREEVERLGSEFSRHPVGTGPFRLASWEGNEIVLQANTDYYEGRPYLDEVVYTVYAGAQNEKILEDFEAGQLEEAAVFGANRDKMAQSPRYQFFRKPTLSLLFYGMNCQSPPLADKRVRQAVSHAINKRAIIREVTGEQFVPATTVLPPGMPGYTPENSADDYNRERAQALLADAGYATSQEKLSLTLLSASTSEAAQQELGLIFADLAAVGVHLEIQYETDWPTFEAKLRSGKVQLYRYAWFADIPDPDNFLNTLCGSGSQYNFMQYSNSKVDRVLSEALIETETLKRISYYREAERIILQDVPMIPWVYLTYETVFQPYVKGLEISSLGRPYIPLKRIWLDKH